MSSSYLKEFQTQISNHGTASFLNLWEEYCSGDEVDAQEIIQILRAAKTADFVETFGRHVEKIIPLWKQIPESAESDEILRLIIDIETSNNEYLREIAFDYLKKYSDQKNFNEKIRLIGIRTKDSFQGAISQFELLNHMEKGNFVFHSGGWGVGEILDVSFLREQLSLEFDYVPGKKDLSFANAFKTLIPLKKDHFLALRFGNPDLLEQQARENPLETVRMLLRDLGPKTAAEIKDELSDLIIPAKEWTRWWQTARGKIKKDTLIETPEELKDPFRLLSDEVSHEERLKSAIEGKQDPNDIIQTIYSFLKDFPETLKKEGFRSFLQIKLSELQSTQDLSDAQKLEVLFFLQDLSDEKEYPAIAELINRLENFQEVLNGIEILAFKKRTLMEVRKHRKDWKEIFLTLFFTVEQSPLRDTILSELAIPETEGDLKKSLENLCAHPGRNPEMFIWYFQKIMTTPSLPFADGKGRFFESLLVLLSHLEHTGVNKDLIKKIHGLLSNGRYLIVRQIMQDSSIEEVQEFLLLATKCHSLSDHDIKILHSLAEVVHPSLTKLHKKKEGTGPENQVVWMTQEGYKKLQQRIHQIATVETVENAKEIETARAHGDLRENMEFKAAREKRDRLQTELKFLSDQINRARVLTKEDISTEDAGVGTIIDCQNKQGQKLTYTILGPCEADPDKYILSFQSKLAQTMKGLTIGDKFKFQDDEYTITNIRSYL